MEKFLTGMIVAVAFSSSVAVAGKSVSVEVTNLTNAITVTSLLTSGHKKSNYIFQVGTSASISANPLAACYFLVPLQVRI